MNQGDDLLPSEQLRATQIIATSLLVGLLIFCGIALWLVRRHGGGLIPGLEVITWFAIAMFVIEVPLSFVVPRIVTRQQLKGIVEGKSPSGSRPTGGIAGQLAAVYQAAMIIGLALLEGVGFLACIAYLLEGRPENLGIIAMVVILMMARFPRADRALAWMHEQAEELERLRQERTLTARD